MSENKMRVAEIWRYPVKSLAGEQVTSTQLQMDGITGDRRVLVYNARTRNILTSRNHPKLLGLKATLDSYGTPLINGLNWDVPESIHAIMEAAGPDARLIEWGGSERHDVLPLLVTSDGALKEFGHDHRRLRPNLVISGVDGLAEREWPGRKMRIGEALIEFVQLRGRCVMTTYDPDTQEQNHRVLREIVKKFDGTFALDTDVLHAGFINVGDVVELVN